MPKAIFHLLNRHFYTGNLFPYSLLRASKDEWVKVPSVRDHLTVNFGLILAALTSNRVKATRHRVVAPPKAHQKGSMRMALPYFMMPSNDAKILIPEDSDLCKYLEESELKEGATVRQLVPRILAHFKRK